MLGSLDFESFGLFLGSSSSELAQESRWTEAGVSSIKALAPSGLSPGFLRAAEESEMFVTAACRADVVGTSQGPG